MRRYLSRTWLGGLALAIFWLSAPDSATAQVIQPAGPYYIVQAGDSLWDIAVRFKVPLADLEKANGIADPNQLTQGGQLVIPGLEGIQGRVDTRTVAVGETLRSLSRVYRMPMSTLARLNRLTNPSELYIGASLIIPVNGDNPQPALERARLLSGQSLLELAVLRSVDPWSVVLDNDLPGSWAGLPGDELLLPRSGPPEEQDMISNILPDVITGISFEPLTPIQGQTAVIKISGPEGLAITGSLVGYDLHFFRYQNEYVALQGIPAMTPPGLYALALKGKLPDGERFAFSQNVLVEDANFPYDPSLQVDPATIDLVVTEPEKELWTSLGIPVTPQKMWDGLFASPVPSDFKDCWTSLFGNRRSYNGGTYDNFHSGLDFCGRLGTELYAVAPGRVVYAGSLTVRGDVVVIDHGWGVYTAYDHLSKTLVQPGDMVQLGQLIGLGGATGRTTGPHLHWEVWVGDVQVNPVDWLSTIYP